MTGCDYARQVCRFGVFVLIFSVTLPAFGQAVSGFLEYQGRRETREGRGEVNVNLATLRVEGATPVGKPWLAQLTGGLGLTYRDTRDGELSQTGTQVTGGARLKLLPQSIFPFEAFVERFDTRIDGELVGPNYQQTRYGFVQSFMPRSGALYRLRYEHADRTDEERFISGQDTNTEEDRLGLEINQGFKNQLVNFTSDYNRIKRDLPETTNQRGVNVLRHRYSPVSTFSIDSILSDVRSEDERETSFVRNTQTQLSSNLFWRPQTAKPLLVTGSVLASGFVTETAATEGETSVLTASGSATYQLKPALSWRTSASLSQNRSQDTDRRTSLARTGLTYSPGSIPVKKWFFAYSLIGDVASRTDTETQDTQEALASLSYSLNRPGKLGHGNSNVTFTQQVFVLEDTADRREQGMTNSATADWYATTARRSVTLRALASDTRRIDGSEIAFQLVNFQANGNVQASRLSSWSGNATVQWSRNSNDASTTPWLMSGSVNLVYRHERVFRVPLLRFSSELRMLTEDLAVAGEDEFSNNRRETVAWINRLDYLIGRTQMSLRGQVSQVDGRDYSLLFLQVRRYFGRFAR
ncbi:MAG: hypothetical protein JSU95_10700 [Betaproteobacteria bacterium]|nr:MAG: hypothetical protein JSU95_10700 [Betaproteobacteria bacterium]